MNNRKNNSKKNSKERSKELEKRTRQFAVRIIKLASELPDNEVGKIVKYQIIKSGTSVGANYREANRAVSRAAFKHKIDICETEASETQYWLEVIIEAVRRSRPLLFAQLLPWSRVKPDYEECSELLAIFTASSNTAKKERE